MHDIIIIIAVVANALSTIGILASLITTHRRAIRKEKRDKKETKKRMSVLENQRKLDDLAVADLTSHLKKIPAPKSDSPAGQIPAGPSSDGT